LIYHAVGYLTHTINYNCSIRANKKLFIQSQCNVNLMFKMKKINEKNDFVQPVPSKKKKKKPDIKGEQIKDKFSVINDIDMMIR
jgi:hypothetical protein